ncbi:MAG: P27 family phage terminase small subunit [Gluconobacter cerinus]|uniref:P27 family phage terminase small subunit n=1 Tax=Gluconobacter cerinus TaxID=38307 RepID=UPI0039E96E54
MGRRAKPDALHELSGNAGKRKRTPKISARSRKPAAFDPESAYAPPVGISAGARVIWLEEIERVKATGYVKASDLSTYRIYCESAARHRKLAAIIEEKGFTYATGTGFERPRPEVSIMQREERTMLACLKELASTASSRMRAASQAAASQGDLFNPKMDSPGQPPDTETTLEREVTPSAGRDPLAYFN